MKKYLNYALFLFIFNPLVQSQESLTLPDGSECGMEGSAKRKNDKALNLLKNRMLFPQKSDLDTSFNWDKINEPTDDRRKFNARRAVILRVMSYQSIWEAWKRVIAIAPTQHTEIPILPSPPTRKVRTIKPNMWWLK